MVERQLRANGDRGDWLGERANAVLRFWDNNPTAVMTGDNTHMWPYGINGAHEDTGSEVLYIGNGLITQALGEDGLPPTGGFATPAYVFEQEDHVKYYLKNEDETAGLYTSYLVAAPNSTAITGEEMTAAEAAANDNAAWYVTFNPKTCYYQLRNVGTGQYRHTIHPETNSSPPIKKLRQRLKASSSCADVQMSISGQATLLSQHGVIGLSGRKNAQSPMYGF